jgi:hypothetical protein
MGQDDLTDNTRKVVGKQMEALLVVPSQAQWHTTLKQIWINQ